MSTLVGVRGLKLTSEKFLKTLAEYYSKNIEKVLIYYY